MSSLREGFGAYGISRSVSALSAFSSGVTPRVPRPVIFLFHILHTHQAELLGIELLAYPCSSHHTSLQVSSHTSPLVLLMTAVGLSSMLPASHQSLSSANKVNLP